MAPKVVVINGFKYVRERKKRAWATPQTKALRERAKKGLGPAAPGLTLLRIGILLELLKKGTLDIEMQKYLAQQWTLSLKRIQQLTAEARRQWQK